MENNMDALNLFFKTLDSYSIVSYEQMPDIDLYMDQVVGFIEHSLANMYQTDSDKVLTPSMVNNYVKSGTIKRPNHKKYNKEHLSSLLMLCMFKQVLPISLCNRLIKDEDGNTDQNRYDLFFELQNEIMQKTAKKISAGMEDITAGGTNEKEEYKKLAMRLVIEANILSTFSKKILTALEPAQEKTPQEKAKK